MSKVIKFIKESILPELAELRRSQERLARDFQALRNEFTGLGIWYTVPMPKMKP